MHRQIGQADWCGQKKQHHFNFWRISFEHGIWWWKWWMSHNAVDHKAEQISRDLIEKVLWFQISVVVFHAATQSDTWRTFLTCDENEMIKFNCCLWEIGQFLFTITDWSFENWHSSSAATAHCFAWLMMSWLSRSMTLESQRWLCKLSFSWSTSMRDSTSLGVRPCTAAACCLWASSIVENNLPSNAVSVPKLFCSVSLFVVASNFFFCSAPLIFWTTISTSPMEVGLTLSTGHS